MYVRLRVRERVYPCACLRALFFESVPRRQGNPCHPRSTSQHAGAPIQEQVAAEVAGPLEPKTQEIGLPGVGRGGEIREEKKRRDSQLRAQRRGTPIRGDFVGGIGMAYGK